MKSFRPAAAWMTRETLDEKKRRARKVVAYLAKRDPRPKIALRYGNPIQLLVAVILSAQCTDKKVNEVTAPLFKKYKTAADFARANPQTFEQEIRQTGFYHAKARNIITACRQIVELFGGRLPRTMQDILTLRGVARKTANVVLGNAYGVVEGIAVDTHMIRLNQRLGFTRESDPIKIERDLMALIPKKDWFRYTYLIINYARSTCPARHKSGCECEIYKIR